MFLGLASLADPPKPTVFEAIQKCRASGVKVIMVTGDQSLTAVSIAKKIGIITHKSNLDLQKEGYSEEESLLHANSLAIEGRQIESSFEQGDEVGKTQL
jgi:magnesium-transporting ATPase (P-type)